MIEDFTKLLNKNKQNCTYKLDLTKISTLIQQELKRIERKENTDMLHDKFNKIVENLCKKHKLKKTIMKELANLKNMFEYIGNEYDGYYENTTWKYLYKFNSCDFCIGCDDENKYFYFDKIIKINNIETSKCDVVDFDGIQSFHKTLTLKYVSVYLLFELIFSVAVYFCDNHEDFELDN